MNIASMLLLFSSIIEPFIWIYAFDRGMSRKYQSIFVYLSYIIGDWILSVIRKYTTSNYPDMNVIFTILIVGYVSIFVYKAYDGKINRKLLVVGLLFLLSLCSDFIVIGILMLFGQTLEIISTDGLMNSIATLFSKGIMFILISVCIRKKQQGLYYEHEEIIPILFGTILYELPSVVLFNRIYLLGDNEFLLILFVFGELVVLCLVVYAIVIMNRKKRKELNLLTRIHDIEIEIKSNKNLEDVITEMNHFRHDIKSHLLVLESLLNEEQYDNARQYLYEIKSEGLDIVRAIPGMKNRNVGIVLGQRKKAAEDAGVLFFPEIMVEDFIIIDKDICSILCNLLDNAIEAASSCDKGFVNVIIKPDADTSGYFIECQNNYKNIELKKGKYLTTKSDKNKHGLGINIIKKIVSKYNGKCQFSNNSSSNEFSVEIYIPGRDVNE